MTERPKDLPPFNERAALDQLEQFRSEIERYKERREAATDDFEQFVRTFPSPADVFPAEQPAANTAPARTEAPVVQPKPVEPAASALPPLPPLPPRTQTLPSERVIPAPRSPAPVADTVRPASMSATPASETPVSESMPAPARSGFQGAVAPRSKVGPLILGIVLLLLVAGGFAVWSSRHADPQRTADTSSPAADTTPPSSDQTPSASAPSTAAAAPAEPPAAASATSGSEITTVRPVWLRVIADGERVVERELPAGTRIPFEAQKTIVIRTPVRSRRFSS